VAQAVSGRGNQLQAAKPAVNFQRALLANDPTSADGDARGNDHPNDGREKNEQDWLRPAADDDGLKTGVCHCGAAVATHESVRRTGGQAKNEGDEIPENGPEQPGEQNLLVHHFDVNHAFANGLSHGGAKHKSGDEIPESGPGHGAEWGKHASGNDGRNRVGGVVPAVGELEGQGQHYHRGEKVEARHGQILQNKKGKELELVREIRQKAFRHIFDVDMRVKRF
jgi:hypothetical protein